MTRAELLQAARALVDFAARARLPLDRAVACWPAGRDLTPEALRTVQAEARRQVVLGALERAPMVDGDRCRRRGRGAA